jgi:hypothetical protein
MLHRVLFASACGHTGVPSAAAALGWRTGVPSAAAALGWRTGVPSAAAALGWRTEPRTWESEARCRRQLAAVGPASAKATSGPS